MLLPADDTPAPDGGFGHKRRLMIVVDYIASVARQHEAVMTNANYALQAPLQHLSSNQVPMIASLKSLRRLSAALSAALLLAPALVATVPPQATAEVQDITLTTTPINLNRDRPSQFRVGRLVWRGGLAITADDRRFGGLSDMLVSEDGHRLLAIGDEGIWLAARLRYDGDGRLIGMGDARLASLRDLENEPLADKIMADAEALALLPDGSLLVGFEREHRIWRYPSPGVNGPERAEAFPLPPGLSDAPENGGLETLIALDGDRVLALTEDHAAGAHIRGYLLDGEDWAELELTRAGEFKPTGGALLPDGDLLLVERRFSALGGLAIRLRQIPGDSIAPGATLAGEELAVLKPPLEIDNFEAIAIRRGILGETLIMLLSDDNFNPVQRTLLVQFALEPGIRNKTKKGPRGGPFPFVQERSFRDQAAVLLSTAFLIRFLRSRAFWPSLAFGVDSR